MTADQYSVKLKTRLKCMARRLEKLTNGGEGSNKGVRENWRDGAKGDRQGFLYREQQTEAISGGSGM